MSRIPAPVFSDRLQSLSHDEFVEFVAALWETAGWDTTVDGAVVVARSEEKRQRLLVLPPRRLSRYRSSPSVDAPVDRVVTARLVDDSGQLPRDTPDAERVDAAALRHRLLYGVDSEVGDQLCQDYLGVSLRGDGWDSAGTSRVALTAVAALVIGLGVVFGLVFVGLPFSDGETATPKTNATELAGGLGLGETTASVHTSVGSPTKIGVGETIYVSRRGGVLALDGSTGRQIWSYTDLPGDVGPPLVVNGTVYVRAFGEIHAIDAMTGNREWAYDATNGPVAARPTVVNGTVYVGDSSRVLAIDAGTGQLEWESASADARLSLSPTVRNGTVYAGSRNGTMYALDAETGNERWSRNEMEAAYAFSPTLIAGSADGNGTEHGTLVVSGANTLYGLDASTGDRRWRFSDRWSLSRPTVLQRPGNRTQIDAMVFVGNHRDGIFALDATTGKQEWSKPVPNATYTLSPAVAGLGATRQNGTNRTVIVSVGDGASDDELGRVYALDTITGTERWRFDSENSSTGVPTVADGTVYVGTENGTLYALDSATGEQLWSQQVAETSIVLASTVVENPVDGDSVDSMVRLGTEGHHDWLDSPSVTPNGNRTQQLRIIDHRMPDSIGAGERGIVEVAVVNTGDSQTRGTVDWSVDWETESGTADDSQLTLGAKEAATARLSVVPPAELGTYEYSVQVGEETLTGTITVVEPARHVITSVDDPGQTRRGDQVEILATVNNSDSVAGTTDIAFAFDGERIETTQVELGANESVTQTFTVEIPDNASVGTHTFTVATDDESVNGTLEVVTIDTGTDALPVVNLVLALTVLITLLSLGWWSLSKSERFGAG